MAFSNLSRRQPRKATLLALSLALSMVLSACGSSSGGSTTSAPPAGSAISRLHALLPKEIRDSGTIRIITNADTSPPMTFTGEDGKSVEGLEPELTKALADVLGVKIDQTLGTFDSIVPGIKAGRADLGYASIGDLKARLKVVDFIDYASAGTALMVPKGNPLGIDGIGTLCGHTVAVNKGTYQEDQVTDQNKQCKAEGKKPATLRSFGSSTAAQLALRSNRADAWLGDSAPVGYVVAKSKGNFELAGQEPPIAYLGYVVNKDDTQLRDAVKAGLEELVKDGTYAKIFAKWGQQGSAVTDITINNALL